MSKFMVMVNGKYMVAVFAESACGAEHFILDDIRYGVSSALAFSTAEMNGDYFANCFERCEFITVDVLRSMACNAESAINDKLAAIADEDAELVERLSALNAEIDNIALRRRTLALQYNAVKNNWNAVEI